MQINSFNRQTRCFSISVGTDEVRELMTTSVIIRDYAQKNRNVDASFEQELAKNGLFAAVNMRCLLAKGKTSTIELSVKSLLDCCDMLHHFAHILTDNFMGLQTAQARKLSKIMFDAYIHRARYDMDRPAPRLRPNLMNYTK